VVAGGWLDEAGGMDAPSPRALVGGAAILFPLVYLVSDFVEVAQGDFSIFRLSLTDAGETGFPLFVVGLAVLVHDRIPPWEALGALAYAYSFVFFTSTVMWAIVAATSSGEKLNDDFGWWMTDHGAVMVIGGIATFRARDHLVRNGSNQRACR
jgi:hypothetical protein